MAELPPVDINSVLVALSAIEQLREMRELQRRFFKGDKSVVGRAKWLERQVDEWLAKLPKPDDDGLFSTSSTD